MENQAQSKMRFTTVQLGGPVSFMGVTAGIRMRVTYRSRNDSGGGREGFVLTGHALVGPGMLNTRVIPSREGMQNLFHTQTAGVDVLSI